MFFLHKWICKNLRVDINYCHKKKIHVKNIKKYRKYFQIEEDGLIISVDLLISNATQIGDGNFQRQNFGVNPKWPWKFPGPKFARGNANNHRNFHGQHFNAVNLKLRRKFPT